MISFVIFRKLPFSGIFRRAASCLLLMVDELSPVMLLSVPKFAPACRPETIKASFANNARIALPGPQKSSLGIWQTFSTAVIKASALN